MHRHRQAFHGSEAVLLSFILSASASCSAMLLDACRVHRLGEHRFMAVLLWALFVRRHMLL